jgi:hypothetical protein
MDSWRPTGRQRFGPGYTIGESTDGTQLGWALTFDRSLRSHPDLASVEAIRPFLEQPNVEGLAPMAWSESHRGIFGYQTGPVWLLRDVLLALKKPNAPSHDRAGLQLLARLGQVLETASVAASQVQRYAHGSLDPYRIALTEDGEVMVLGYALPHVTLHGATKPDADVLRYCAPETIARESEDVRTDLLTLALIGFEWFTGTPLYTGDAERVLLAARRGMGHQRLYAKRHLLDDDLVEVLTRSLGQYPDSRYASGDAFRLACLDVAGSPRLAGPDLAEVMQWVAAQDDDGPRPAVRTTPTVSLRNQDDADALGRETRWGQAGQARIATSKADPRSGGRPKRRASMPDHNAMYPTDPVPGDAQPYRVTLGDGTQRVIALSLKESLAKSAARLIDQLEFSPVDLMGRIRGWYRITQGEDAWFGHAPTSNLQPEVPLTLEFFDNQELTLRVSASQEGRPVKEMRVGTAVHAQFLVGEFRRQFELPGTRWRIKVEEVILDPWQVLDDFALSDGDAIDLVIPN